MLSERYSVEVSDGIVLVHGYLHLDEFAGLLQHFSELGYEYIYPGYENSALCLSKTTFEKSNTFREKKTLC